MKLEEWEMKVSEQYQNYTNEAVEKLEQVTDITDVEKNRLTIEIAHHNRLMAQGVIQTALLKEILKKLPSQHELRKYMKK